MSNNLNVATESATSLRVCESKTSIQKSKESIRKPQIKELLNRNLDKSLLKLCSDADLRIKVLLSNTACELKSSSSKILSSKEISTEFLDYSTKPVSSFTTSTSAKSISFDTSKLSVRKSTKHKNSCQEGVNSSINSETDNIDEPTTKQLTVMKILTLRDLASKMEKRQRSLIKNQFESTSFQRSYADGLEKGIRYGYFDNPNEEIQAQTEKTDSTFKNNDKFKLKKTEVDLYLPENKDSKRMRGGFQDPQQKESRLKDKLDQDAADLAEKQEGDSLDEVKPSNLTITNEFPSKCDADVNVQAFNQKYGIKSDVSSGKTSNITDRREQYLQYFEKLLASMGEDFSKGFKAGFGDGFEAANIFFSNDIIFSEDEKQYISHMRKCLKSSDVNLDNDVKNINARAAEMKKNLNIPNDEFEDISYLIRKGLIKKSPLKFSKNDYKHYTDAIKQNKENAKIKPSYEDDNTEIVFTSYPEMKVDNTPQHTKNRALRYLKKHKINEFFQFLGSHLVATKPEDPISFLINLLDKCLEYRFNEYVIQAPLLFTRKHVESVYFVLDPMVTGYIDMSQYIHGMEALGLRDNENLTNFRPGEKIDKYIFITNACQRLLSKFREMIAMDSITALPSKVAYTYTNIEAN